jgi:nitrite reductase/ring-hydroxylating ferredoxin subunit
MNQNQRWIKIAGINESVFEKSITALDVEGQKICIIKTTKGLKACSSLCPHASGDLSTGFLDKKENIVCPVHGYHFNLDHGRDTNNEGYFLKIFKIKKNEEGVFVEIK